jgi:Domain of unknown function (DUF4129)
VGAIRRKSGLRCVFEFRDVSRKDRKAGREKTVKRVAKTAKQMLKLISIILLTLLMAIEATAAARLLNYENRVVRAAEQIERIKSDKDYGEEGVSYIKRLLPRSEQIEFERREVTVDNSWLYILLDSYTAESDPQRRNAVLNEAAGRLRALDEHLRRAEAAASGETENPRDRISEILSRPAYQPERETAIGGFVKRVFRKVRGFIGEVYSSLILLLERLFGVSAQSAWFSNIVLIAVLAAAIIAAVAMIRRRRRTPAMRKKKTRTVLGEEIGADSTSSELAEAGLAAARAGDFRTAVRKLYVALLYELAERNLIELDDSATNHEYLKKVSRFAALASPMTFLTDRFDYVWYGMFPSTEEDFAAYLSKYEEAITVGKTLGEQSPVDS